MHLKYIFFLLKTRRKSVIAEILFNLLPIKNQLVQTMYLVFCVSALFQDVCTPGMREPTLDRTGAISLHLILKVKEGS